MNGEEEFRSQLRKPFRSGGSRREQRESVELGEGTGGFDRLGGKCADQHCRAEIFAEILYQELMLGKRVSAVFQQQSDLASEDAAFLIDDFGGDTDSVDHLFVDRIGHLGGDSDVPFLCAGDFRDPFPPQIGIFIPRHDVVVAERSDGKEQKKHDQDGEQNNDDVFHVGQVSLLSS